MKARLSITCLYVRLSNCSCVRSKSNLYDYESMITCVSGNYFPLKLNSSTLYDEINFAIGGIVTFRKLKA